MPETNPYQRVLALVKFDGSDERIARKALLLARLNRAELMFLHLVESEAALDGGYPTASARANAAALEAAAQRRLAFLASRLGAGEAACTARHGPARQAFKQLAREWRPDLVVSAQGPDFLSGTHDVLILGQNRQLKGGKLLGRMLSWVGARLLPAAQ